MGSVFAAYDPQLDRKVALKILHRPSQTERRQREWTLREARALARVTHPNVVSVHEVGEAEEQVYLAMEFVDGVTLRHWQTCQPRSWRDVLRMYLQAGEGLWAAHQAGVIHRDFKPDNVLVGRSGIPKVADFGIARLHEYSEGQTEPRDLSAPSEPGARHPGGSERPSTAESCATGSSRADSRHAGTVGYMSPEQRSGGALGQASDQWSFCAALHEAIYGRLPDSSPEARAPQSAPAQSAGLAQRRSRAHGISPELHAILLRGLSHDPHQRFRNMGELLRALWAEHDQSPEAARKVSNLIVVVTGGIAFLLWLVLQYMATKKARIIEFGAAISWLMVLSALVLGYRHRVTLRNNSFHRWIWLLMLINYLEILGLRMSCMFLVELPFRIVHVFEMIVWTGTLAILAVQLLPIVRWALVIPAISITVCLLIESPPRRLLLLSYPMMVFWILWWWRQASYNKASVHMDSLRRPA